MKALDKKELKELLVKCWITHDGLWFYHSLKECGIEKTNRVNKAAARAIGSTEARRIVRAFGLGKIDTFEKLRELMDDGFDVVMGEFMGFTFDCATKNVLHVDTERCFAYEGISKMGAIEGYDCGIFARIAGWFDGLEIEYEVDPPLEGCLMHSEGKCFRNFSFSFP